MSVIVKASGNIGPFASYEVETGLVRTWPLADKKGHPTEYNELLLGSYTISNDDSLAPQPLPPHESLSDAIERIKREFEAEMAGIKQTYPDTEREGWPQQQLEATALQGNPAASTPILDAIIAVTGEGKAELAASILAKVAAYSAFYGAAVGRRRLKTLAAFEAAANE